MQPLTMASPCASPTNLALLVLRYPFHVLIKLLKLIFTFVYRAILIRLSPAAGLAIELEELNQQLADLDNELVELSIKYNDDCKTIDVRKKVVDEKRDQVYQRLTRLANVGPKTSSDIGALTTLNTQVSFVENANKTTKRSSVASMSQFFERKLNLPKRTSSSTLSPPVKTLTSTPPSFQAKSVK